jgi:hypothetical protein
MQACSFFTHVPEDSVREFFLPLFRVYSSSISMLRGGKTPMEMSASRALNVSAAPP